jgi:UDP-3-O-[3-hydroxymyristoyl] glucosamine N-acyltransferase
MGCVVGKNCIVHAGTVIGSDGFGFAPTGESFKKIPQIGNVVVEDDVEIGSNCSIDRATMGSTIIRKGVKLDNLIQIAHNVEIGENTVMAGQSGVAGSTKLGKNCMVGGQVGFAGHIVICDNVKVGAQAGVGINVKENGMALWSSPAFEYKKAARSIAVFKNLPELATRINQLERELNDLRSKK